MSLSFVEPGDTRLPTVPAAISAGLEASRPLPRPSVGAVPPPDDVDDAAQCSFPASDPPGWNTLRIGPPHKPSS